MTYLSKFMGSVAAAQELCTREVRQHPLLGAVISGDASREELAVFYTYMYLSVRNTVPHLHMALRAAQTWDADSDVLALLAEKINDETGHEVWLLSNLKRMGVDPRIVDHVAVPYATSESTRSLRAACREGRYCAVLGEGSVREYLSVQLASEAAEALVEKGKIPGIDGAAVSFLAMHGALDREHGPSLDESIAKLKSETQRQAVVSGAESEAALFPHKFPRRISLPVRALVRRFAGHAGHAKLAVGTPERPPGA